MSAPVLSTLSPPMEVDPPQFVPFRFGLLSASQVDTGSGRWELGGVTYPSVGCRQGTSEWETLCPVIPPGAPQAPKPDPLGLTQIEGKPFTLVDSVACNVHSGRTEPEVTDLARLALLGGEQRMVEQNFWASLRAQAVTITPPNPATFWNMCEGLGVLEQVIAEQYGGVGVIHAPRYLLAPAVSKALATREGDQLVDPAGNLWAFGAGYDRKGPPIVDPADPDNFAPAGQLWLYATGPVVLRRSEVMTHPALDHRANARRTVAERNYVLTADCPAAAVLVKVPEC